MIGVVVVSILALAGSQLGGTPLFAVPGPDKTLQSGAGPFFDPRVPRCRVMPCSVMIQE